jgi:branched-subunit amino acid permease
MSDGTGQLHRTVFDIICCMLVGPSFGKPKVFEIRYLVTVISVKEG